jgi:hypothetical protein
MANTLTDLMMRPDGTRWNGKWRPEGKQWWWEWDTPEENKLHLDRILEMYTNVTTRQYESMLRQYDVSIQQTQNDWTQAIQEGRYRKIPALEKRYNFLQKQKYDLAILMTNQYMEHCGYNDMVGESLHYVKYREQSVGW